MTVLTTAEAPQVIGGALKYRVTLGRVRVGDEAYADLRRRVKAAGLLERAYGYYAMRGPLTIAFLAGALLLMFTLPASWGWSLLAAACFGFASVQVSMLGHDAGHLGIFKRTRANFAAGQFTMTFLAGVSFWYWCNRHNLDASRFGRMGCAYAHHPSGRNRCRRKRPFRHADGGKDAPYLRAWRSTAATLEDQRPGGKDPK